MSHSITYPVDPETAVRAWITEETYRAWYRHSIDDPVRFWEERAREMVHWFTPWTHTLEYDFFEGYVRWFEGATTNVSYNCLDRHLKHRGDQIAIIWEGDDPSVDRTLTYRALHDRVCRLGNALKAQGVRKGDRVCIYMPMIPEAAVAMLACTRIGAIHSVVFGGFSPSALRDRILDADCRTLITADEGVRGGRTVPLRRNVDTALADCPRVTTVITVRHTGGAITWVEGRDLWYHDALASASADCPPEPMEAEAPLFILYTSGSTGKPKGVQHTTGGYLLFAAMTHKYIFDYHDNDIYWCTADVGWITGHSYIVYGPLANGATTLMFEGVPTYPDAARFWQVVDKHAVTIFYTAPTAIRALMSMGDAPVRATRRTSLRLLGSVGEPINPEAWEWYHRVVGERRCPIVDTWWQTETGGIMITPLPGATPLKPGSATRPFFGVQPRLVDPMGEEIVGPGEGHLVISFPWPGMMRTIWGNHKRFLDTYLAVVPGAYFTGDGCRRDEDGDYWITGRVDDTIIVSGHNLGTAEIESAMVLHESVSEAAAVGYPHPIKGQGIYVYVTTNRGVIPSDELKKALIQQVRQEVGPIAQVDIIQWASELPKTRSGKIMRRILRKIAHNQLDDLGDTSTLAEASVVDALIQNRIIWT